MPLAGFEPTISAGKQPHNYALDCMATGTSKMNALERHNDKTATNVTCPCPFIIQPHEKAFAYLISTPTNAHM